MKKIFFLTILFAIYSHSNIIGSAKARVENIIDGTNIDNIYKILFIHVPCANIHPGDNVTFENSAIEHMTVLELLSKLRTFPYFNNFKEDIIKNTKITIETGRTIEGKQQFLKILYKEEVPIIINRLVDNLVKYLSLNFSRIPFDNTNSEEKEQFYKLEKTSDQFKESLYHLIYNFFEITNLKKIEETAFLKETDNYITLMQNQKKSFRERYDFLKDFNYDLWQAINVTEKKPKKQDPIISQKSSPSTLKTPIKLQQPDSSLIDALELASTLIQ